MADLPTLVRQTQETLGTVVKRPMLTEKLLSRPPFRFLHDVVSAVINNTGFMAGLYSETELQADTIKDREGKIAFLQKAIDCVQFATGESLAIRPAKTVAGQEAERTNEFLQLMYKGIQSENGASAVERVLNHEKPSPSGSADSNKENRTEEKKAKISDKKEKRSSSKDRKAEKSENPEKKEPRRSDSKSRKSTDDEEKAKPKERKSKESKDAKPTDGARRSDPKTRSKTEGKTKASTSDKKRSSDKTGKPKERTTDKSKSDKPPKSSTEKPEASKPPKPEKPKESSRESSPKKSPKPSPKQDPEPPAEPKPASPPEPAARPLPAAQPAARPTTAMRRVANDRPQSAIGQRPTTARPAPPRVRKGIDTHVEEAPRDDSASSEKTAPVIITETAHETAGDTAEDFLVQEADEPFVNGGAVDDAKTEEPIDDENHGVLVETILKKKKEFEETFADEDDERKQVSVFDEKQRENARKDARRMQDFVQLLTRTSHPLGRLLDFMQEDIDSMIKEIGQWQGEHKKNLLTLHQHKATAVNEIESAKDRLEKLEGQIAEQRKKIAISKAATLEVQNQVAQMANSRAN